MPLPWWPVSKWLAHLRNREFSPTHALSDPGAISPRYGPCATLSDHALSLSTQCQAALATIVGNSDASCLNAQALIGLVVSTSSTTNTSIVPTVNTWLTGMCSRPACTNATLATVVSSVTAGCPTELGELGLSDVDSSSLTALVQSAYPTVRQVACLGE